MAGERILVVDDEGHIREIFAQLLAAEGYEVTGCGTVEEVAGVLAAGEFDLAFVDIRLGAQSGLDVLRLVRERLPLCPVVIITGSPTIETAAEALRHGAFDYIVKPIRQEALLRISRIALEQKELLEERERYRGNIEAIFRSLRDLVVMVDENMTVLEANEARGLCGIVDNPIAGASFPAIVTCEHPSCVVLLESTLRTGRPMNLDRVECRRLGRRSGVVSLATSPLLDTGGRTIGAVLVVRDETRLASLERELSARRQLHGLIGESQPMQELYKLIERLAEVESTVLVTGESGTGKELVAEAIHHTGRRSKGPLIKVNCAALTESLLESELFGHVKGAFTGAVADRAGRFKAADGGTIFLDEIGDISPGLQVRLLRVLQNKEIERVGDATPQKVDVRVIAATNRNLPQLMAAGKFREDLYYRLRVVEVRVPPLRERKTDIPLLTRHFLDKLGARVGRTIEQVTREAMERFLGYEWPGNVRELEHTLERAMIVAESDMITTRDLTPELRAATVAAEAGKEGSVRERIEQALTRTGGNRTEAARMLGWSRRTFYRRLEECGLGGDLPNGENQRSAQKGQIPDA
jgi:DNA-binding NtrC family response regulator